MQTRAVDSFSAERISKRNYVFVKNSHIWHWILSESSNFVNVLFQKLFVALQTERLNLILAALRKFWEQIKSSQNYNQCTQRLANRRQFSGMGTCSGCWRRRPLAAGAASPRVPCRPNLNANRAIFHCQSASLTGEIQCRKIGAQTIQFSHCSEIKQRKRRTIPSDWH